MGRNSFWVNGDGLAVGFGTHSADNITGGVTAVEGIEKELVLKIADLTQLNTAANAVTDVGIYGAGKWANAPKIPAYATVQSVRVTCDTAATSGGAADLQLGAYTISDTTGLLVAVDADGFFEAADGALADFSAVGETVFINKNNSAAALVGEVSVGANPVVVVPTYVTAAYTAGALTVVINYTIKM